MDAVVSPINTALRRVPAWSIYIVGTLWAIWLFWQAATQQGRFLADPVNVLEREYGEIALQLMVAGLMVTPLRKYLGLNLMKFRRAIGVAAFFFVLAHFLVFAILDVASLSRVVEEVWKRPYVTVGFASFLMMIPLAVTSNNRMVKRLGAGAWRNLHKLTYPAAVLGAVHYLWLVKGFQIEPLVYLGVILALLSLRIKFRLRGATVPTNG